jgi:predicted HicB family RNase H-like nuclease
MVYPYMYSLQMTPAMRDQIAAEASRREESLAAWIREAIRQRLARDALPIGWRTS